MKELKCKNIEVCFKNQSEKISLQIKQDFKKRPRNRLCNDVNKCRILSTLWHINKYIDPAKCGNLIQQYYYEYVLAIRSCFIWL